MRITILHVGKIRNRAIDGLIDDYVCRLGRDICLQRICVKDAGDPMREGSAIIRILEKHRGRHIALAAEGKVYDSIQFAQKISSLPPQTVFILGGPAGLSHAVKSRVHEMLSLSAMTLPHELAHLILVEQIYRAWSILHNKKYHKP